MTAASTFSLVLNSIMTPPRPDIPALLAMWFPAAKKPRVYASARPAAKRKLMASLGNFRTRGEFPRRRRA